MATFTALCAEKLRRQHSGADTIMVFLMTHTHAAHEPPYNCSRIIELPVATAHTAELTGYAVRLTRKMYQAGYCFKKTGVVLGKIVAGYAVQGDFLIR